jgi:hypothetical protein
MNPANLKKNRTIVELHHPKNHITRKGQSELTHIGRARAP